MSAMDQAFIKAYAKDAPATLQPAATRAATVQPAPAYVPAPTARVLPRELPTHVIEQAYRDGALYRIDAPAAIAPRRAAVPVPHLHLPPRTSPRRNIRRSMLKLLGHAGELATPMPVAASVPSATSRGNRRSGRGIAEIVRQLVLPATTDELAPEVVIDAPQADEPAPTVQPLPPQFQPAAPLPSFAPPNIAPLNLLAHFGPEIEVHGHWESDWIGPDSSLVVLPEPANLHLTAAAPMVELRLDALPLPVEIATVVTERATPIPSFRLDPPHAAATSRPHAKFAPSPIEEPPDGTPAIEVTVEADDGVVLQPVEEAPEVSTTSVAELAFVESERPSVAAAPVPAPETTVPDNCVPLWEVDKFQWPATVERLVSDKDGYFAQASQRLLAAVHDGLRTLGVTGSRRGEGRTTLSLCLARSAATAGIQVALIDADFSRPQLAGKLGIEVAHGWQDAATGLVPLSEAAVRSLSDGITVLPLEASAARGDLSLSDPRVTATLRAAAATFDLLIVDLGPLASGNDDLFPADEACPLDAAIIVRDLRYASAAESAAVGERLHAAGVEAVGIAENFVVEEEIPVTSV